MRPVRQGCGRGLARPGRNAGGGMRPAADRGSPAQLALPARPPHRRLRPHHQPGDRLSGSIECDRVSMRTPRSLGFRMPAEWEPHEATWIAWPHNREDWPGRFAPIPWVYGEIVRKLSRVERMRILVENAQVERQARRVLRLVDARMEAVEFIECPTNRVWTHDYGPLFLKNRRGEGALAAFRFNAWAKYDDWQLDAAVPAFVGARLKLPMFPPPMVLEGGGIDVNGQGLLLTTEECLLSPVQARNPGRSEEHTSELQSHHDIV